MREVRDRSGRRYVLIKRSSQASLVADPQTGERRFLPNETLERQQDANVPDLLAYIDSNGPVSARSLLDATTLCESDLYGQLADLQIGGYIEEVSVYGERGYAITASGAARVDQS